MNCFECAKANDTVPAVGVCQHCGVGLCLDHLIEAGESGRRHALRLPARDPAHEAAARRPRRHHGGCPPPHRAASRDGRDRTRPLEHEVALLAKALGHPARVRIMRLLLAHDACYCGQLVDELSLAQATVSQHLKVLKDAGLIVGEIEGLRTCYCASRDRLAELHDLVGGILDEAVELDRVAATESSA